VETDCVDSCGIHHRSASSFRVRLDPQLPNNTCDTSVADAHALCTFATPPGAEPDL
jgi:hypothetical protein